MAEQQTASSPSPLSPAWNGAGERDLWSSEEATPEETAAIMAVLALMRTKRPPVVEGPRISPWARAGRREAVRPWAKQE